MPLSAGDDTAIQRINGIQVTWEIYVSLPAGIGMLRSAVGLMNASAGGAGLESRSARSMSEGGGAAGSGRDGLGLMRAQFGNRRWPGIDGVNEREPNLTAQRDDVLAGVAVPALLHRNFEHPMKRAMASVVRVLIDDAAGERAAAL